MYIQLYVMSISSTTLLDFGALNNEKVQNMGIAIDIVLFKLYSFL